MEEVQKIRNVINNMRRKVKNKELLEQLEKIESSTNTIEFGLKELPAKKRKSDRFNNRVYEWIIFNQVFIESVVRDLSIKNEIKIESKNEGWKKAIGLISWLISKESKNVYFTEDAYCSGALPPSGIYAVCVHDVENHFSGMKETRDKMNRNSFIFLQSMSEEEKEAKLKEMANILMPKSLKKFI